MRGCRIVKTGAVFKMSPCHAEHSGFLIHEIDKSGLAACYKLSQSGAGVVRAVNGYSLK